MMRFLIALAFQAFAMAAVAQPTPVLKMSSQCLFGVDEGRACIDSSGRMGFCLSEPAPAGGGTAGSSCVAPVSQCSDEDVDYEWACMKPGESQLGVCRKSLDGGNVCSFQNIEYFDTLVPMPEENFDSESEDQEHSPFYLDQSSTYDNSNMHPSAFFELMGR